MAEVTFFSESDMTITKEGKKIISSEYPLWYNRQMLDELTEDIRMADFEIKSGRIKDDKLAEARSRLDKLRQRASEIEESLPKLDGKLSDKLDKVRKELGKQISSKMFSRSDMKKGLADPHEEARRMSEPSIVLSPEAYEVAAMCNVKPFDDGRVSRTMAEKIWKIAGRVLDENSNVEVLRKD